MTKKEGKERKRQKKQVDKYDPVKKTTVYRPGFSKRIEVGVSIYKVGGEFSAGGMNRAPQVQVGESPRGGFPPSLVGGGYRGSPPENFEILDCRRCILSIFCH